MKTPDTTDSLPRVIVYAPYRGKIQYASNADASSFTKARAKAFHFASKQITEAALNRLNGGGSYNCYAAFANA